MNNELVSDPWFVRARVLVFGGMFACMLDRLWFVPAGLVCACVLSVRVSTYRECSMCVRMSIESSTGKCVGFGGMFASSSNRPWFVPADLVNFRVFLVWVSFLPGINICNFLVRVGTVGEGVCETGRFACSFPIKSFYRFYELHDPLSISTQTFFFVLFPGEHNVAAATD